MVKVILWGDEYVIKSLDNIHAIYYEKDRYSYIQLGKVRLQCCMIHKEDTTRLYEELENCQSKESVTILLIKAIDERIQSTLIQMNKEYPDVGLIVGTWHLLQDNVNPDFKKEMIYIPKLNWQEVFQYLFFIEETRHLKQILRKLKGATLVTGYTSYDLLKRWHTIQSAFYYELEIYSHQAVDIQLLSELEDGLRDYISDEAKLQVNWLQNKIETASDFYIMKAF